MGKLRTGKKMLYLLLGQEDYSRRQALEGIKKDLGDHDFASVNITVLEGQQVSPAQLRNICETVPFLSEKRLVIVEGLLSRFEPKGRST